MAKWCLKTEGFRLVPCFGRLAKPPIVSFTRLWSGIPRGLHSQLLCHFSSLEAEADTNGAGFFKRLSLNRLDSTFWFLQSAC